MTRASKAAAVAIWLGVLGMLAGCGVGSRTTSAPGVAMQGQVHGGQQPVAGASVFLYAAGSAGNGQGAVNLLAPHAVLTDATGGFNITGDYVCPTASTPVYLLASGGNPGLTPGTNNAALMLVAALGDCGNLSASTYISVDEVTTAAAAWALNQFAGNDGSVGASATNLTGLRNAFGLAALLADSGTGFSPGAALPAGASLETGKLYALANSLASCVNSDGGSACQPLLQPAAVNGTPPATTWTAALNIVRNPAANVGAIYAAASAAAPFRPALAAAPSDWTMSVTFGACSTCGGLNEPGGVAIDSTGSVWVANYFGAAVSRFSPAGVPAAPQGFHGVGLNQSYAVAIDSMDNAWVTNQQSISAAGNSRRGSISKFTPQGTELSANGFTGGGVFYPQAIAADVAGMWIADYGSSSATLLAGDGSALSPANGYAPSALPFTSAVAVDASHNAWFAVQGGVGRVSAGGVYSGFPCCTDPTGVAVDQAGTVWIADYGAFSLIALDAAGNVTHRVSTVDALLAPQAVAIDGAGNVWAANYFGDSVTALTGATAALRSPVGGFGQDASLNEPFGLAIDASGNVWLSNAGNNTLTALVGVASPVRTPMLGPPVQP